MVFGFLDGSRNLDRSTAFLGAAFASDVAFPFLTVSFHFSPSSRSDLPSISILMMVQVPSNSSNLFRSWATAPAVKANIDKSENATHRGAMNVLLLLSNQRYSNLSYMPAVSYGDASIIGCPERLNCHSRTRQ